MIQTHTYFMLIGLLQGVFWGKRDLTMETTSHATILNRNKAIKGPDVKKLHNIIASSNTSNDGILGPLVLEKITVA